MEDMGERERICAEIALLAIRINSGVQAMTIWLGRLMSMEGAERREEETRYIPSLSELLKGLESSFSKFQNLTGIDFSSARTALLAAMAASDRRDYGTVHDLVQRTLRDEWLRTLIQAQKDPARREKKSKPQGTRLGGP